MPPPDRESKEPRKPEREKHSFLKQHVDAGGGGGGEVGRTVFINIPSD